MPGAWEPNYNVMVAILHVDVTTIAWSLGLRNLQIPGAVVPLAGMPYDHSRNVACQHALSNPFSHLFFLDSDVVPPADALLRLLAHNKPIISGMYCRRSPPHGLPVAIKNGAWLNQLPSPNDPNKVIEVEYVGAGCLLIKRQVLEVMAAKPDPTCPWKPWFSWKVDAQGHLPREDCLSEDYVFSRRAKQVFGIPTLLDTSLRCRHVGLAEAGLGSFIPCVA